MHLGQRLGEGFFRQSGLPGGLTLEGRVAQRPVGRLGLQARLMLQPQVVPCAGPQVMGRRGGLPHRHRQPFQVLLTDQAKACALDERCTKAPFPERAAALVTGVEAAHVLTAQRLHDSGQGPLLARGDEQMHPVGQQQPGMQRGALLAGSLTQDLTKRLAVLVVDEHRLVVVAAQQDVMELAGQDQARAAGHRFIPASPHGTRPDEPAQGGTPPGASATVIADDRR